MEEAKGLMEKVSIKTTPSDDDYRAGFSFEKVSEL